MNSKYYSINKNEKIVAKITKIAVIVGVIVVIGVIGYQINETTYEKSSTEEYYDGIGSDAISHVVYPDNPQSLYGVQINKDKYLLGENVYVRVTEIPRELKTELLFYTPTGKQFFEIPIDGEKSQGFKQYFKPQLLKNRNLCDVNDLIGQWTVLFQDNPSEKIFFEFTGEYLPGNEKYFESLTCGASIQVPMQPDYIPPED